MYLCVADTCQAGATLYGFIFTAGVELGGFQGMMYVVV